MADAFSAGTVVVVEEFVISPPANRASSALAATEENAVVGLAALKSYRSP